MKLRVTHNRIMRKISTPYYVEAKYVTPDLEITDKELLGLCEDLCSYCRKICRDSGFTINRMSVDELMHVPDVKLAGSEDFHLDFCKFWREQADTLSHGTRRNYITALNAFKRFIRTDSALGARRYNLAKECFMLSFGLIGMNSIELYICQKIENGVLIYHRKKRAPDERTGPKCE